MLTRQTLAKLSRLSSTMFLLTSTLPILNALYIRCVVAGTALQGSLSIPVAKIRMPYSLGHLSKHVQISTVRLPVHVMIIW